MVKPYDASLKSLWDTFVLKAKNGTFLFMRDFMEYHSHKFQEASLVIFKDENLVAVLPANLSEGNYFSHQGLTYGGLLYSEKVKLNQVLELYKAILVYLNEKDCDKLIIKELPCIYQKFPNDDFKYMAFILNARLLKRDSLSVIDYSTKFKIASNRKEGLKKAEQHQLILKEENDFQGFWNTILEPNLFQKYQTNPVHSLEEIQYLKSKFPNQIRQFNVYKEEEIVAGTTIFETETVAHCQYISANSDKNKYGSLDFLHYKLITDVFKTKSYYDFGISNENNGRHLNKGLLFWKEGFGARTVTQDVYEIETNHANLIDDVLI